MSNVNGVSSSSYSSSIYGSRNVLTGLASGLDTETMIENSIQGYKTKIQNLIGQQTKLSWKQDAYRSITDKMIALREKYTSYTSKTNLSSRAFFNNSVNTTTNGENKDKISATGKTSSDVKINAVKQLATAAKYTVSGAGLAGGDGATAAGAGFKLKDTKVSKISGSMTLSVGKYGQSVTLDFGEGEIYGGLGDLAAGINAKLSQQKIGETTASDMITASIEGGKIVFKAGSEADKGDAVWISGASGKLQKTLGLETTTSFDHEKSQQSIGAPEGDLYETRDPVEYFSNKTLNVTLDGVTKKVSLGDLSITDEDKKNGIDTIEKKLLSNVQTNLKNAFGDKVTVSMDEKTNALSFSTNNTTSKNSTLKVTSEVGSSLGLGNNGITNYLDTSKTLGDLLGYREGTGELDGLTALAAKGRVTVNAKNKSFGTDEAGNTVMNIAKEGEKADWRRVDNSGNLLYAVNINGQDVGAFTKDTALESVISAINNSDAGVKVSYSQLTNKFTFSATETGSQGRIDFGEGLASKLFGRTEAYNMSGGAYSYFEDSDGEAIIAGYDGDKPYYMIQIDGEYVKGVKDGKGNIRPERAAGGNPFEASYVKMDPNSAEVQAVLQKARAGFTAGQDAIFSTTVNGEELTLTRSTNTVNIDGLSVTLKDTFNGDHITTGKDGLQFDPEGIEADSAVTFSTKADADKIVDAIKTFVDDFNAIITETRSAYNTSPLYKNSSKDRYEPLTDDDKEGMSDSEIERYEEKAKTGILFGDGDLRRAYDSLRNAISVYGDDRKAMEAIGLTTTYSEGVTTLSLDETKLREALENNPDSVMKVFTDSRETGASTDGIMARVKKTMDTYASTSIGKYGVLVQKAGTKTKSLTLMSNSLQKQINNLDDQIDKWQERMSDKIDYYTGMFTQLEQLMTQMNSQSSTLAGLMGGY